MPIFSTAVTTIECDGHHSAPCPNETSVEFQHPQSVAIRLAKQSGWTIWMESTCPECVAAEAADTVTAPTASLLDPEESFTAAGHATIEQPQRSHHPAERMSMLVPAGV